MTALNPYQILYSQTARDYQIACLFGLVSFVAFLARVHAVREMVQVVRTAEAIYQANA